jgi:hypothetical protein
MYVGYDNKDLDVDMNEEHNDDKGRDEVDVSNNKNNDYDDGGDDDPDM